MYTNFLSCAVLGLLVCCPVVFSRSCTRPSGCRSPRPPPPPPVHPKTPHPFFRYNEIEVFWLFAVSIFPIKSCFSVKVIIKPQCFLLQNASKCIGTNLVYLMFEVFIVHCLSTGKSLQPLQKILLYVKRLFVVQNMIRV